MFLANEATDASTMEQISICVCFVDRKDEDSTLEVREEFLGFVEAESTKGAVLAANVDNTQQHRANRDFKQATTFSRSLQVVYFVKCRQTHTHRGKKFVFICLCPQ